MICLCVIFFVFVMIIVFCLITQRKYVESFEGKSKKIYHPYPFKNAKFQVSPKEEMEEMRKLDEDRLFCYNFPNNKKCKKNTNYKKDTIDGSKHFPPVDGISAPNSLSMFSFSKCDPSCCPSEYTCGSGCYCLTDDQKRWLNKNGKH